MKTACISIRSFSRTLPASLPRLSARLFETELRPTSDSTSSSEPSAGPSSQAPTPWFLSEASSSAPALRPSFLPPPPRTAFLSSDEIPLPPPTLPKTLRRLHDYLHAHPLLTSPVFIDTSTPAAKTIPVPRHPPRKGAKRIRGAVDSGPGIGFEDGKGTGGWWDWVVVVSVEGWGGGEVKRAEGAVREWLSLNPITLGSNTSNVVTKTPRVAKGTTPDDWALIDTGVGLVVHVMAPEARSRWDIEGVWKDAFRPAGDQNSFGMRRD